jgi:HD-GYP domain-containing protein (c-di-GMP phosphodiesterase class II)
METLTLQHSVYLPGNETLFPPGTVLTQKVLQSARERISKRSHPVYNLLHYLPVKNDLHNLFQLPPYSTIIDSKSFQDAFLTFLNSIQFPEPILQILEYFRVKDFYTYRHTLAVMALATNTAMNLFPHRERLIYKAAVSPSHDVGKFCIPALILHKSLPLSQDERSILEHHCAAGYALLKVYLGNAATHSAMIARDHHERKDESGYPRGISLKDELVELISVCDIYDALISSRPYRPLSYDNRTALEELTRLAEQRKIQWKVVKALIAANRRDKPAIDNCRVSTERRGTPPADNNYYRSSG